VNPEDPTPHPEESSGPSGPPPPPVPRTPPPPPVGPDMSPVPPAPPAPPTPPAPVVPLLPPPPDIDLPPAAASASWGEPNAGSGVLPPPPPPQYPPFADLPAPLPTPAAPRATRGRVVPFFLGACASLLLATTVLAGVAAFDTDDDDADDRRSEEVDTVVGYRNRAPQLDEDLEVAAAVTKAVSPSVVQIQTSGGLGSGFVYDAAQGLILTAAHVIDDATDVTVVLADGRRLPGTVVGTDENSDTAVVRVSDPAGELVEAALAVGVTPLVGQTAIAIGSPFGLEQTVTQGIVSALNRAVPTQSGNLVAMIQTDASINSGNSGGPLVDRYGEVIGINVQIRTSSGDNAGIGFAVPIDLAYEVATRLVEGKPVDLGYLGVSSSGDAPVGRSGALITQVVPGSPAALAGVQVGDLVLSADGRQIKMFSDLAIIVRAKRPGQVLRLVVDRNGTELRLDVTVGKAG